MSEHLENIASTSKVVHTSGDHTSASKMKPASETDLPLELAEQLFSSDTNRVFERIRQLEKHVPTSSHDFIDGPSTVEEELFDARAEAKILYSEVSMHFGLELRERLFDQIDRLHDPDDWEDGDTPIQQKSLKTFLRWFYLNEPEKLPSFGLSDTGYFVASWLSNDNKDRLVLEFLSNDRIKWFVTKFFQNEADHSAGVTDLSRISSSLNPYEIQNWLSKSK